MNRIFTTLAIVTVIFVAATYMLGLSLEMGDIRNVADTVTRARASLHRLVGLAAGMFVILIDSVSVTYFVGTSRWVKEVCDTYGIDQQHVVRSTLLKRASFPWAVTSMLVAVVIVGLGGAADPSATTQLTPIAGVPWKYVHLGSASLGLLLIIWAFLQQSYYLSENQLVIGRVMEAVRKIRSERGLDVT